MAKTLNITLSDDDFAVLQEASRLAGRSPKDFVTEEAMSLADVIAGQGSIKGLTLARHRDVEAAEFIAAFTQSEDKATPVAEWVRRQSVLSSGPRALAVDPAASLKLVTGHTGGAPTGSPRQRPQRGKSPRR